MSWLDKIVWREGNVAVFVSLVLLLCSTATVCAQSEQVVSGAAFAEKIYLQSDAEVYNTSDTIWFKAVAVESAGHRPSTLSGVLHVELVGPDEKVVDQKRIKLTGGIGSGGLGLKKHAVKGTYLLRAYTEWNQNFGSDFIAQTYVRVLSTSDSIARNPMTDLRLVEWEQGKYRLQAQLHPELVDPTQKREKLTVYLTVDGKKDTVLVKGERSGRYPFDYLLPERAKVATVNMETHGGIRYTKTLALQEHMLDVQFFPESGQLVQGATSKVGFKALNGFGRGTAISGVVMDSRGHVVTSFKSNHLGMGSFTLTADNDVSYYAVLDSSSAIRGTHRYPLPEVVEQGQTLSVINNGEEIGVSVYSSYSENDSLFVQVSCRGMLYYNIRASLKKRQITTSLPAAALPEGILSFTLLNRQGQRLAERLFFNRRADTRLHIDLSMNKSKYQERSKADLLVRVTDNDGKAVDANVSMLVMNKDHVGSTYLTRENLLSRLLLSSELRGTIEEPGYYFREPDPVPFWELDALMLTQGWRKYHYDQPLLDTLLFPNEPYPYISGRVTGVFSKKVQAGIGLTMMAFGEKPIMTAQATDSLGRFYFGFPEVYADSLDVLIQSANKAGKNRDYTISLDERKPPSVVYDQYRAVERMDSVVSYVIQKRRERTKQEDAYRLSSGEILLDEVVVERRALSAQQQEVLDRYGESDVVISGDAIQEKEQKWSYGLYSVLMFNFPKDLRITRKGNGGHLHAEVIGGGPTLVVVDGIPVLGDNYDLIPNIPPSEVKSVELIRYAKGFMQLYQTVYPNTPPLAIPTTGSVIAIYTDAGKGVYAARRPIGLLQTSVPVYSPTVEFYTPRYESPMAVASPRPDLRTLIHWAPELTTDDDGVVETTYEHSDVAGETIVVVEALSTAGEIGYKVLKYEVIP